MYVCMREGEGEGIGMLHSPRTAATPGDGTHRVIRSPETQTVGMSREIRSEMYDRSDTCRQHGRERAVLEYSLTRSV